jgi:hypothetical protein
MTVTVDVRRNKDQVQLAEAPQKHSAAREKLGEHSRTVEAMTPEPSAGGSEDTADLAAADGGYGIAGGVDAAGRQPRDCKLSSVDADPAVNQRPVLPELPGVHGTGALREHGRQRFLPAAW